MPNDELLSLMRKQLADDMAELRDRKKARKQALESLNADVKGAQALVDEDLQRIQDELDSPSLPLGPSVKLGGTEVAQ